MLGIALMVPWQDPTQHHFSYIGAACALKRRALLGHSIFILVKKL